MSSTTKKPDLWYVHFSIIFILMFVLHYFIKPTGALTQEGINVLCIFAGLIYGWGFYGLLIPSFMALVALGFTGLYTVSGIVIQGFGNDIVIFVLLLFIYIGLMQDLRITDSLAAWMLKNKLLRTRPWMFSATMGFVAFLITALTNSFVALFMVWGMWYTIFKKYEFEPRSPFVSLMMLGTCVGVVVGAIALPFKNVLVLILAFQAMLPAVGALNYITYCVAILPVAILLFVEYFLLCKYVFKIDISRLVNVDVDALINPPKWDKRHYIVVALFVALLVVMFLQSFFPAGSFAANLMSNLGFSGLGLIMVSVLLVLRHDGKPILSFQDVANKYVVWDAVMMVVVIMLLSPIISNPATGINQFVAQTCMPLFGGLSPFMFMIVLAVIVTILTNFLNNMIVGFLFMNVVVAFYSVLGFDPWAVATVLFGAMHLSILCPAANGNVALTFAMSDWVDSKFLYKATIPTFIVWLVTFCTVGVAWINFIFKIL